MYQRLDNKQDGVIIVVMQRLHVDDLTGHLLKQEGWEVLSLPAVATADESYTLADGRRVGRKLGEVFHPNRENREQLYKLMHQIGAKDFMAQYQQSPYKPGEGNGYHGAITLLRHPDEEPHPGRNDWYFGHIAEEEFVRDKVFGERMKIMPGIVPFQSNEGFIAWAEEYMQKAREAGEFDEKPYTANPKKH
ncbi:MAG: hypothetical protein AAGI37_19945 [Planctomycetota bacterium]